MEKPSSDPYAEWIKILLGGVLLALIILPAYFFVPVEMVDTSIGNETLLLCDFHALPSSFVNGTTILEIQTPDGDVSFVLSKGRFRPDLTGAVVRCKNAEVLAISPSNGDGHEVISGQIVQMLTTDGELRNVLLIDSIHEPLWYEDWVSRNRFPINWIFLIIVWLGSSLVFLSLGRIILRDVRRL